MEIGRHLKRFQDALIVADSRKCIESSTNSSDDRSSNSSGIYSDFYSFRPNIALLTSSHCYTIFSRFDPISLSASSFSSSSGKLQVKFSFYPPAPLSYKIVDSFGRSNDPTYAFSLIVSDLVGDYLKLKSDEILLSC